jgi:DNA-binding Xre family transcriptional regulator
LDIISYKKLWKLLIDLDIKKKDLQQAAGVSSALIAKMGRNENVSTDSLVKICTALNCDIGDIIEIVPTVRGFFAPFPGGRGIAWSPLFAAALWFRSCHSEERSNEESFLLGSQDPSTSSG